MSTHTVERERHRGHHRDTQGDPGHRVVDVYSRESVRTHGQREQSVHTHTGRACTHTGACVQRETDGHRSYPLHMHIQRLIEYMYIYIYIYIYIREIAFTLNHGQ
jgi:hypothetical protein